MRGYTLHKRMTQKRREWLERLRDHGPAQCGTNVGFHCRHFGWTQWIYEKDGERKTAEEIDTEYGSGGTAYRDGWLMTGMEAITDAGRDALMCGEHKERDDGR